MIPPANPLPWTAPQSMGGVAVTRIGVTGDPSRLKSRAEGLDRQVGTVGAHEDSTVGHVAVLPLDHAGRVGRLRRASGGVAVRTSAPTVPGSGAGGEPLEGRAGDELGGQAVGPDGHVADEGDAVQHPLDVEVVDVLRDRGGR